MIETIHDVGECTSIEELQNQIDNFAHFMGLVSTVGALGARIKELEEAKQMIKDSGDRTEFETGAKRDMHAGKGRMDLLPWYGIMEVSKHCEEGALKYGEHNVDKGIPLHSLLDSASRHLAKYMVGMDDEDHLRAACWNLLWALNQRETHPELDDRFAVQAKKKSLKCIMCTCGKTLTDEHGRAFRDVEQDINLPMLRWMLRCPECKKVTVVNWKEFINE